MFFAQLFVVCVLLNTSLLAQEWTESTTEDWPSTTEDWPSTGFPIINCGENITDYSGQFSSPNYPNTYPHNADCVWIITSPNSDSVVWLQFDWPFTTELCCDFLEIRDGPNQNSPLITRMAGTIAQPFDIVSRSRYIWAWFHSDHSNTGRGFRVSFNAGTEPTDEPTTSTDPQTIPTTLVPSTIEPTSPPTPGCSHSFEDTWGTFNSPEFPFYYPFNSDCEWRFSAPQGFRVHITLAQQLSLEHDRECAYDYLEFRDGPNPNSPIITRICGYHEEPLAITSSSNSLYARFHSDDQINAQGFVGVYQTRQVQKLDVEKRKEQN